jgi:secreted trypsin-like serine protease
LVASRYVITAAHCTDGQDAASLKVVVGDTSLALSDETPSFTINVKTIKQHPQYNPSNIQNDISVLELEEAVDLLTYPNIKPICLPAQSSTFFNTVATVSGWGTLSTGGVLTAHLHEVDVTVFADGDCGSMNSAMTSDMICAGLREGGKDACQGDSGGPLFVPNPSNNDAETLIGVVSWGFGCANAGQLGIYAEVAHFRDWLDSQMTNKETCAPPSGDWAQIATCPQSGSTSAPATTVAPTTVTPVTTTSATSSTATTAPEGKLHD